jgi:hypothetical protein
MAKHYIDDEQEGLYIKEIAEGLIHGWSKEAVDV